jgi:hypothetical protein
MNKIILFAAFVLALDLYAEELEPSSETVSEENIELAPAPDAEKTEATPIASKTTEATATASAEEAPVAVPVAAAPPAAAPVSTKIYKGEEPDFNPRQGHWLSTYGFEGVEYKVPTNFTGTKEKFEEENRQLYGGRIALGREFHLGWGFNTTTKLEGFYMGTLFEKETNAGPEQEAETFAYIKRTGHVYGGDVTQSIGRIFDLRTKNPFMDEMTHLYVEPFVFAGMGRAKAYNRLSYHYDLITKEDYRLRVEDDLTTASFGGGINFTSKTGFFLYLKGTQYRMDITKRTTEGYTQFNAADKIRIKTSLTDVDPETVTIYALGGGYKF